MLTSNGGGVGVTHRGAGKAKISSLLKHGLCAFFVGSEVTNKQTNKQTNTKQKFQNAFAAMECQNRLLSRTTQHQLNLMITCHAG